jgi:hypothetical protein
MMDATGMVGAMDAVFDELTKGVDAIPTADQPQAWRELGPLESNTPPVRNGFDQMWVRVHDVEGRTDARNIAKRRRQGWSPRVAAPEEAGRFATIRHPALGNLYASGSCILFERKKELSDAARNQIRQRTLRQSQAADLEGTKDFDGQYASLQSKTRTTVKQGRDAAQLVDS